MSTRDYSVTNQPIALATAPPLAGSGNGRAVESEQPLGQEPGAAGPGGPGPNPFGFMLPIILIFGLLIVFQIFAGRKERKKREQMLSSIKKYDKVQTVGGLIGAVHEVRDNEIVLKVDESTNTKVSISRGAVQQVLRKGPLSSSDREDESQAEADADSRNEPLQAVAS